MTLKPFTAVFAALILLALGAGAGVLGYVYFVGGSGEASTVISAPTLSAAVTLGAPALATENALLREQLASPSSQATPVVETLVSERIVFRIVPEDSQVSFTLEEDLRGSRTVVTGITNQVAGDILVDFAQPDASQVGTIRINMRTLATDTELRNRAIRSNILRTSQADFEFSEFVPTALNGLPDSVSVGDTITFQVTGDFGLVGLTRPITFDVTLTLISDTRIEGVGTAQVLRSDYGLQIPSVPGVANVTDEVELSIDFVAEAVTE
jgi:polyisoprenoid-binding protein YceI